MPLVPRRFSDSAALLALAASGGGGFTWGMPDSRTGRSRWSRHRYWRGWSSDRILREIYDVDLFNPPPAVRGEGRLLERVHKAAWEGYPEERWREIRRAYGVRQVLTPSDWMLALPISSGDRRYLLYEIPE